MTLPPCAKTADQISFRNVENAPDELIRVDVGGMLGCSFTAFNLRNLVRPGWNVSENKFVEVYIRTINGNVFRIGLKDGHPLNEVYETNDEYRVHDARNNVSVIFGMDLPQHVNFVLGQRFVFESMDSGSRITEIVAVTRSNESRVSAGDGVMLAVPPTSIKKDYISMLRGEGPLYHYS